MLFRLYVIYLESKESKFNTNVIHVFNCDSLTEPQIDFLTKLLFLSKYNPSFNLNRLLVELCMNTKLKKNVDDKSTQLLIFYKSPFHLDLQSLQTKDFFNTYHPLKLLELEPSSFCKKQSVKVTTSKNIVTSPIFNNENKINNKGEIFQ